MKNLCASLVHAISGVRVPPPEADHNANPLPVADRLAFPIKTDPERAEGLPLLPLGAGPSGDPAANEAPCAAIAQKIIEPVTVHLPPEPVTVAPAAVTPAPLDPEVRRTRAWHEALIQRASAGIGCPVCGVELFDKALVLSDLGRFDDAVRMIRWGALVHPSYSLSQVPDTPRHMARLDNVRDLHLALVAFGHVKPLDIPGEELDAGPLSYLSAFHLPKTRFLREVSYRMREWSDQGRPDPHAIVQAQLGLALRQRPDDDEGDCIPGKATGAILGALSLVLAFEEMRDKTAVGMVFQLLECLLRQQDRTWATIVVHSPLLAFVHEDPRWPEFLDRSGLSPDSLEGIAAHLNLDGLPSNWRDGKPSEDMGTTSAARNEFYERQGLVPFS